MATEPTPYNARPRAPNFQTPFSTRISLSPSFAFSLYIYISGLSARNVSERCLQEERESGDGPDDRDCWTLYWLADCVWDVIPNAPLIRLDLVSWSNNPWTTVFLLKSSTGSALPSNGQWRKLSNIYELWFLAVTWGGGGEGESRDSVQRVKGLARLFRMRKIKWVLLHIL